MKAPARGGRRDAMKRWIGLASHAALGAVFPYALGGAVVLFTGIDSPPDAADRLKGLGIAAAYIGLAAAVNAYALRGLSGRSVFAAAFGHLAAWAVCAACAFALLRM